MPTRPYGQRPTGRREYQRLLAAGVNAQSATILSRLQRRPDDERAYWRQLAAGLPRTPEACAAHARAQAERRRSSRAA